MSDTLMVLTAGVTVLGLLFGFYKWWISREDKRHQAHEERFAQHFDIFTRHEKRIEGNEKEIRQTRDELHREYVRGDQLDRSMEKIGSQVESLHKRLGGIARELNQAIGSIKASKDAEMQNLVKEIKEALKHGHE